MLYIYIYIYIYTLFSAFAESLRDNTHEDMQIDFIVEL